MKHKPHQKRLVFKPKNEIDLSGSFKRAEATDCKIHATLVTFVIGANLSRFTALRTDSLQMFETVLIL